MLRYYPSFRVKTNLVAGENLFTTTDGKSYTGPYYETFEGRFFSGPNPIIGPNTELKRVQTYPTLPGLSSATNTQTTSGNEFLLDGVPYVGQYYQDAIGNYYAVEPTSPSSLSPATNAALGSSYATPQDQAVQTIANEQNQANAQQAANQQSAANAALSNNQQQQLPASQLNIPISSAQVSASIAQQSNLQSRAVGNLINQQQTLASASLNSKITSIESIPLNQIIVDSKGNRFVRGPQNELIPYEEAQRALQESKRQTPQPRLLQPIAAKLPPPGKTSSGIRTRSSVSPLQQQFIFNLKVNPNFSGQPIAYYPNPTQEDYDRGYFFRYFVKKINQNGYIIEISQDEYNQIKNGTTTYDVSFYQVETTFWKLTGNLRTVRLSQYDIRDGIIDTNKRFIENIEKTFVGIKAFIGEQYDKFARPNNSPLNR